MRQVYIYALVDPRDESVRYIGKAIDAQKRFKQHLNECNRNYPVYAWIGKLRGMGFVPRLDVLRTCDESQWQDIEREEIAKARAAGNLLNVAEGGDQPFCSVEVRAVNGRKNALARENTPLKKRVWMLKQRMGILLKDGSVRESAKVKLRQAAARCPELFGDFATV